jgi:hypothetical protein
MGVWATVSIRRKFRERAGEVLSVYDEYILVRPSELICLLQRRACE